MADTAIKVVNVSKTFKLPHEKQGSVKGLFLNIFSLNRSYEKQKALQNISLDIKKGEFFGIIGRNGGGKSTLLKILAGVYTPDEGGIKVHGKLTPFIELGVGFNPELTGRENVYLNGALLGFDRKEMHEMYDDIVKFAELEKFMDQKLKNYSSGMQVRLAFSIAIRAKSDILLIDEVLAVGDSNFQKKCIEIFEELKRAGRTIVFVSHSMGHIREFCDRVAVIAEGQLVFLGNTEEGVDIYNKLNFDSDAARITIENQQKKEKIQRFGNGNARITKYKFINDQGKESIKLAAGKKFTIELELEFRNAVTNPAIGIMFRKNPQENLFGINNFYNDQHFGSKKKGDRLRVNVSGIMPLATGDYYVSLSVADARSVSNYSELDTLHNALKINVTGKLYWGLLSTEVKMEAKNI